MKVTFAKGRPWTTRPACSRPAWMPAPDVPSTFIRATCSMKTTSSNSFEKRLPAIGPELVALRGLSTTP